MLRLSPAGRFEIERRWKHSEALVDMCDQAALPVPLLESALCAARSWGEGLYSNMPTEAEAKRGRELQEKLDSHRPGASREALGPLAGREHARALQTQPPHRPQQARSPKTPRQARL